MMKIFQCALEHWPHDHPFRAKNFNHLRGFIAVRAGWSKSKTVKFSGGDPGAMEAAYLVMMAMTELDVYADVELSEQHRTITKTVPKSLQFSKMTHGEACKYFPVFQDVIADEIGIKDCDELLRETASAA